MLGLALTAGAQGFDNLPDPIEDVNKVVDNTPDSIAKALMSRPKPGSTRKGGNPVLFLIGNSTMRNGTRGDGSNGQWGWGYYASQYFDDSKITVENQALGGMSTRTFYTDLWPAVRDALKAGDWVVVSIGHNDNGEFFDQKRARAVIPGVDPDTCYVGFNQRTQRQDTVYSYGTYLRKYIKEIRARGAHPILMSLTPRDAYDEKTGKIVRKPQTEWGAYIAAVEGVPYVDLNERSGQKLDSYSPWKEKYHFFGDKIHTSKFGAEMNARSAAEGIWESQNPQLRPLQQMMQNVPLRMKPVKREAGMPTRKTTACGAGPRRRRRCSTSRRSRSLMLPVRVEARGRLSVKGSGRRSTTRFSPATSSPFSSAITTFAPSPTRRPEG